MSVMTERGVRDPLSPRRNSLIGRGTKNVDPRGLLDCRLQTVGETLVMSPDDRG